MFYKFDTVILNLTAFKAATFFQWLEKNSQPCFYKKNFGFECPGCGFQRAFIELIHGNIWASIKLYPALLPLILMFLVLLFHMKFRLKHGAQIIKYLFICSVVLIIGNFIFKLTVN